MKMNLYERIKNMSMEEMKDFIYWVYLCGNKDGRKRLEDSPSSYFGGYMLELDAEKVIPNNNVVNLFDSI